MVLVVIIFALGGCIQSYQEPEEPQNDVLIVEQDYQGVVKNRNSVGLANVTIKLQHQNQTVSTKGDGSFVFEHIQSSNDTLLLSKEGYYTGVYTYDGLHNKAETFILDERKDANIRFLFTGDLSFARRFMDPLSEDRTTKLITEDVEGATLKVSNLYESGQSLINPIRPLFESVDFPTVNFETIATHSQETLDYIHPTKDYAYYTDTFSIALLKDLNVNFVTLGNNHVYDYNTEGLVDTIRALDDNGIGHSGAGVSVDDAFEPYHTSIKGKPLSFVGATSILGDKHALLYVAHEQNLSDENDTFATQGGAANAHDSLRIASRLQEEASTHFPIYQFHGGIEYTFAPNSVALRLMQEAVANNAEVIISHHPHTAQGYGMENGVLMAYGMGNFIFDQDRLDTLFSHILVFDLEDNNITHARGYPIYIKNYTPQFLTGDTANRFIRHISEASRNGSMLLETPLKSDFMVFPYQHLEYLSLNNQYTTQTKRIDVTVDITDKGYGIVDLRGLVTSEYSLSNIDIDDQESELNITIGRDLLWFGSFEDDDSDELFAENSIWNFGTSVASSGLAHQGRVSAHLSRNSRQTSNALLYFGRRIRVIGDARDRPNKSLSFFGYFKGINSRPFSVESRYYASLGDLEFGSSLLLEEGGGTFDWHALEATIAMPKDTTSTDSTPEEYLSQNARALRFFIRMRPTNQDEANLYADDLAIINWEESYVGTVPISLSTPHSREFLKVQGRKGAHKLRLTFKKYLPILP